MTNLSLEMKEELLTTLKVRFLNNMNRHEGLKWEEVEKRLEADPEKLWALYNMEQTGGEPDVILYDAEKDEYIFCDCAKETPKGRVNTCYDEEARIKRKKFPPEQSALGLAEAWGIELMTETEYRYLQSLGEFDTKTSSWLKTPDSIRKLGGAIFGDRRYNTVFVYHNGADSYYAVRGFRGILRV
ncbi:MAG: DUF4256 domain-containing protein [Bacilli bacterium]|nr:DUF4256 domain-containing protein [Bacilli bacterium]